jgi:two-component system, OmpR family, phosphate regulon sensor histidine kinase PhoR
VDALTSVPGPEEELPASSVRAAHSGALHAKRQARIGLGAALALLVTLVLVALYASDRLYTSGEATYLATATPLRTDARDLSVQLANEDQAIRLYISTRESRDLEPFAGAQASVSADLAALASATDAHPALQPDIDAVHARGTAVAQFFNSQLTRVRSGPAGRKKAYADLLVGEGLVDQLRFAVAAMGAQISEIVGTEHVKQRRTYVRTEVFLIAAGSVAALIGIALFVFLPRRLERLYRREQDARVRAELGANAAQALAHVGEAVVLLDEHDRVAFWNEGAEPLLGGKGSKALGRPATEAMIEFPAVAAAASADDPAVVPLPINGEERWYAVSQTTFAEGRVLVLRDVTDAQALEQARTDFVTTAAHELRTPISAIFGAAQTLRRSDIELTSETRDSLLEVVESESERLTRLAEQILTTAQLDRGEELLTTEQCDLRAVCEGVVRAFELTKPESVTLVLDTPEKMRPLDCDEERLRQVVSNLVGNAVKYSPAGGTIAVSVVDGVKHVRIDVQDEGIGIPHSAQERIFDKFSRLDPALTRGIGGTGLGLYISRGLVEQMGGEITVRSRPNIGSTFSIELPRRR